MKGKFIVAALVLLCVCIVCQDVFAQPQQDRRSGRSRQGRGQGDRGPGQRGGAGFGGQQQGRGGMGPGGGMFGGLDLTEEQQKQMAKIREEVMAKMRDASPEQRREIFGEMREKMKAVLTKEQQAKAAGMFGGRGGQGPQGDRPGQGGRPGQRGRPSQGGRRPGQGKASMGPLDLFDMMSGHLKLSKEQEGKIARLRAAAMRKLMKDIKGVLTQEQKAAFAKAEQRIKVPTKPRPDIKPEKDENDSEKNDE